MSIIVTMEKQWKITLSDSKELQRTEKKMMRRNSPQSIQNKHSRSFERQGWSHCCGSVESLFLSAVISTFLCYLFKVSHKALKGKISRYAAVYWGTLEEIVHREGRAERRTSSKLSDTEVAWVVVLMCVYATCLRLMRVRLSNDVLSSYWCVYEIIITNASWL